MFKKNIFKNKRILITGGLGMIGQELVELLVKKGAYIYIADLKRGCDLRNNKICLEICKGKDYVFHLMGITGNPKYTNTNPIDFIVPMLQCDTNMIKAAIDCKVKKFLYTSSIAVLNQKTDKYPAHAKLTGELLLEAAKIQYPWFKSIVCRPANVYGRYTNFDNPNAMVITSLIKKFETNYNVEVWGTGEEERSFINAKDVAEGMIKAIEYMPKVPINLTGKSHKIKEVVNNINKNYNIKHKIIYNGVVSGAKKRIMKSNGILINWKPKIDLKEGIKEIIAWRKQCKQKTKQQ